MLVFALQLEAKAMLQIAAKSMPQIATNSMPQIAAESMLLLRSFWRQRPCCKLQQRTCWYLR